MAAVRRRRGAAAARVSEDDCLRAIQQLRELGGGWDVFAVGTHGVRLVRSVPAELSGDGGPVLSAAASGGGVATERGLALALGWPVSRCRAALDVLLREGVAWLDTQGEEPSWWFWSLRAGEGAKAEEGVTRA